MASPLERLRAQRATQLAPKHLTLPITGWSGLLHVRYQPVKWEALTDLLVASIGSPKDALDANCNALGEACGALLVKGDDGELKGLADELRAAGETVHGEVRFDEYAIDALELTVKDAVGDTKRPETRREIVLAVFAGAVSPELAIAEDAARLGRWMRSVEQEVDDSLVGG